MPVFELRQWVSKAIYILGHSALWLSKLGHRNTTSRSGNYFILTGLDEHSLPCPITDLLVHFPHPKHTHICTCTRTHAIFTKPDIKRMIPLKHDIKSRCIFHFPCLQKLKLTTLASSTDRPWTQVPSPDHVPLSVPQRYR